jgi:hypothetical protein
MFNRMPFSVGAMKIKTWPLFIGAAVLLAGTSTTVIAQELRRGAGVLNRPKPELDPLGVRAGGFLIFPNVELGTTYDDNVFATENNKQGDFRFQILPTVAVESDFNRHLLRFSAGADVGRYVDNTSENYIDYFFTGSGRYDITGDASVSTDVAYRKLHEDRGDPDSAIGAAEPIEFSRSSADLTYQQRFNRVTGRVGVGVGREDYDDVPSVIGVTLDQDDRDRWSYTATGQVGYDLYPGYQPFLRFNYTRTEYDEGTVKANSDNYEAVVGTSLDLTNLLTGEIFVGYLARNYDEDAFDDFSGVSYGLALDYSITQLTTLNGKISRAVEDGFSNNPNPRDRTTFRVGVDHELLRNLILSAKAEYQRDDYLNSDPLTGLTREDDFYLLQAGATYKFNRNLYLSGTYSYSTRDTNRQFGDYDRNLFMLRVGAQL